MMRVEFNVTAGSDADWTLETNILTGNTELEVNVWCKVLPHTLCMYVFAYGGIASPHPRPPLLL